MGERVRLGTRGSALALAQSERIAAALRERGLDVALVRVRTAGDRNRQDSSMVLGVGVFVKELEEALLADRVDLAVHSAKDLPTAETAGLVIAAYPPRGDPWDALVSRRGRTLQALPPGARVGTDSPRRRAFLLAARPDLQVAPIRGNVDTRLRKLEAGEFDAIVVASVALQRLGLDSLVAETFTSQVMLPAVAQGAVAVQTRVGGPMWATVAPLDHLPTRQEVTAERAFLRSVGGGCRAPIAALARSDGMRLTLEGVVISPEGRRLLRERRAGRADQASVLAEVLGAEMLARGAATLQTEPVG